MPCTVLALQNALPMGVAMPCAERYLATPARLPVVCEIAGEDLTDDRCLGGLDPDGSGIAWSVETQSRPSRDPVDSRRAGASRAGARPPAACASAPAAGVQPAFGDEGALVLGDGATDLQQQLIMWVRISWADPGMPRGSHPAPVLRAAPSGEHSCAPSGPGRSPA
jgi:hypothetical protein